MRQSAHSRQAARSSAESLRPVEVIVWNPEEGVTHRLTQFFRASEIGTGETEEAIVP